MKYRYFLLILFGAMWLCSKGQGTHMDMSAFREGEKHLQELFDSLSYSRFDDERTNFEARIQNKVRTLLEKPGSFLFPFDSTKVISVVGDSEHTIRLITWVIPSLYGTYTHYGYVQTNELKPKLYELKDNSANLDKLEQRMLDPDNWFGAVYYGLIEKKVRGKKVYTLLGFHGNNALTTMKVIDVMFFDDLGKLKFGAPIFKLPKKLQRRVVFEYSAQASMSLKYHRVRTFLFFKKNLIVFDHLAPPDLSMLNQYQYYGPDFSNDALKFKNGRWVYITNVDARNPDK